MNYFIFTAIVLLAASKSKVQIEDNRANNARKDSPDGEKAVARKTS